MRRPPVFPPAAFHGPHAYLPRPPPPGGFIPFPGPPFNPYGKYVCLVTAMKIVDLFLFFETAHDFELDQRTGNF
jgi:hypothetical protein